MVANRQGPHGQYIVDVEVVGDTLAMLDKPSSHSGGKTLVYVYNWKTGTLKAVSSLIAN